MIQNEIIFPSPNNFIENLCSLEKSLKRDPIQKDPLTG